MQEIQEILQRTKKATSKEDIESLIEELTLLISKNKNHIELLHGKAELYIKLQLYGKAINDYRAILAINENDKHAAGQVEMLTTILRFTGNDIYANPNTNLDPWME